VNVVFPLILKLQIFANRCKSSLYRESSTTKDLSIISYFINHSGTETDTVKEMIYVR
jgi:hypothetical protein